MTISKEKLNRVEQDAEQLINNLRILNEKVGSYSVAKETLEKTKTELVELINETRNLIVSSHEIVKTTKEIGAIEISKQLDDINQKLLFFSKSIKKQYWIVFIILLINIILNMAYLNLFK